MKKAIFYACLALWAHLVFFAFTGLALWAQVPDDHIGRALVLIYLHIAAAPATFIFWPDKWRPR